MEQSKLPGHLVQQGHDHGGHDPSGLTASSSPSAMTFRAAHDAEHGVVDAVAFQVVVAEDLPALHAGEGVLDAGADLAMRGVVFLFPGRQFGLLGFAAVRNDEAGVPVATTAGLQQG